MPALPGFFSAVDLEAILRFNPHFGVVFVLSKHPLVAHEKVDPGLQMQPICQGIVRAAAVEQLPVR